MLVSKILCRKIYAIYLLLLTALPANSEPLSFSIFKDSQAPSKTKKTNLQISVVTIPEIIKPGKKFTLHIQLILEPEYHIYSLKENFNQEQLATQIKIKSSELKPLSNWVETPPKLFLDPVLEKTVKIHDSLVQFNRDYKTSNPFFSKNTKISGNLFYRICDNKTCSLPLNYKFKVNLKIKEH